MWLLLLMLLAPAQLNGLPAAFADGTAQVNGAATSNGPVSSGEASVLWREGRGAFEAGRYQDAVNSFQRLVDRYPGYPGYLEAHRYLGRALMLLGRTEDAVKPLKYYADAAGTQPMGLRVRLWLGEDYLMTAHASEAYLDALGIERQTNGGAQHPDPELYAESQFLKTRALMALNQDRRAKRVLDSIESEPVVQSNPTLKGHLARAQIELKVRACSRLPGKGPMTDGQARDRFSRRALCLSEALVLFKSAAESGDTETTTAAESRISEAYTAYASAVRNPPPPPRLKPSDRTAEQKKQYKAELSDRLDRDRQGAVSEALNTLAGWRSKALASGNKTGTEAAAAYAELARKLGALPGGFQ